MSDQRALLVRSINWPLNDLGLPSHVHELKSACLPGFETSSGLPFRAISSLKETQFRAQTTISELPDLTSVPELDSFSKTMTDSYFTALAEEALKKYLEEKNMNWAIQKTNCWANFHYPFFTAQPDGLLVSGIGQQLRSVLEIKTYTSVAPSLEEVTSQVQRTLNIMGFESCLYLLFNRDTQSTVLTQFIWRDTTKFDLHAESVKYIRTALAQKLKLDDPERVSIPIA